MVMGHLIKKKQNVPTAVGTAFKERGVEGTTKFAVPPAAPAPGPPWAGVAGPVDVVVVVEIGKLGRDVNDSCVRKLDLKDACICNFVTKFFLPPF